MRDDFMAGYMDGLDPDAPAPSENRTEEYRHSFDVGRREITGRVLSAQAYRDRADRIANGEQPHVK